MKFCWVSVAILWTVILAFGCAVRSHFPKDPHVVYTPVPRPDLIWYCEKQSWGGARCDAITSYELMRRSAENNASLVCAEEKGFTKTCWRAQDMDDKGAYSY